jgi:hypothetical protein
LAQDFRIAELKELTAPPACLREDHPERENQAIPTVVCAPWGWPNWASAADPGGSAIFENVAMLPVMILASLSSRGERMQSRSSASELEYAERIVFQ